MLTKSENKVMNTIYEECKDKRALLISPKDLINMTGDKTLTLSALEKVVLDLHADGYFDVVYSDRHGERVFCLSLTEKGKGYKRNVKLLKRNLIFRLMLTVGFALVSFLIGVILRAIF